MDNHFLLAFYLIKTLISTRLSGAGHVSVRYVALLGSSHEGQIVSRRRQYSLVL